MKPAFIFINNTETNPQNDVKLIIDASDPFGARITEYFDGPNSNGVDSKEAHLINLNLDQAEINRIIVNYNHPTPCVFQYVGDIKAGLKVWGIENYIKGNSCSTSKPTTAQNALLGIEIQDGKAIIDKLYEATAKAFQMNSESIMNKVVSGEKINLNFNVELKIS